ncbi:hypothetical protein PN36_27010 [Candidatus Thiomargarita nelsonii]|uniref:Endonuclease GajA/Old nuclease/RecF-like AAA domain-containing protein n=1 Tax=Candidatus Thiomargarita nelsonii TaxID=1003181 RepID=A0A0A6P399_9GAMM|nr:hypothetical protein PN36_27010 [Candidatus Thiomargarita nelsonii]
MQLIIKNFGPLKKGEIDLSKKFYVFVGDNNTGKTYLSQLLWCIFNEETIDQFAPTIEPLPVAENLSFEITPALLDTILDQFARFLTNDIIPKQFNVENNTLILENLVLKFQYHLDQIRMRTLDAVYGTDGGLFFISKNVDSMSLNIKGQDSFDNKFLQTSLVKSILRVIFNNVHNTFFLPASRIFFPIFYYYIFKVDREDNKKISQQLVDYLEKRNKNGQINLQELPIVKRPYNELMGKLFEKINELWETSKPNNHYAKIVAEISKIIGGDIVLSNAEKIGPIEISFRISKETNLPMYLSSSAVNQLATLYLYFQYWAKADNNFLMVDEPEENLHPRNQIALCNALLKFVKHNNNRVLINTHSPLIAENINNYLYLHILKAQYGLNIEEILADNSLSLRTDIAISAEELGVYFFNGHELISYEAEDYGVYFRDFQKVNNEIKKSGQVLTDYIYLKEHEHENVFEQ